MELRLVHYLRFATVVLVAAWLFVYFGGGGDDHDRYASVFRQFRDQRAVFVDDFLGHDVSGRFDGSGIMDLCTAKRWTPGLVLTCDAVRGGGGGTSNMADVKNGVLTCLRIAIEMGAEVVLPRLVLSRGAAASNQDIAPGPDTDADTDAQSRGEVPLDRFFDRAHLLRTLADACPQLKVHGSPVDVFAPGDNKPDIQQTLAQPSVVFDLYSVPDVHVQDNPEGSDGRVIDNKVSELGGRIHRLLNDQAPRRDRQYPFRVELRPTPTYALLAADDPPQLHNHFGRVVQVRADLRALAAAVLFNLQQALGVTIDPRKGIDIDAFVAIEINTEQEQDGSSNSGRRPMPPYEVQASDALAFAVASNMTHIYLTEGAQAAHVEQFVARARDFGLTVTTKDDLVDGADAVLLGQLTGDERRLVDYEVALRAGQFVGSAQSSFAWNVGLRREFAFGDEGAHDAKHLQGGRGDVRWFNQYSTLYGRENVGDELRRGIWP